MSNVFLMLLNVCRVKKSSFGNKWFPSCASCSFLFCLFLQLEDWLRAKSVKILCRYQALGQVLANILWGFPFPWKYFLFRMDKSWPKSYDLENSCWSCKTILRICQLDFANESNLRGWQFNSTSPVFFFWSKLSILVMHCISEKCLNWVRSPTGARVSFLASRELNFNCAHLYSFWQTLQVIFRNVHRFSTYDIIYFLCALYTSEI